MVNDRSGPGRSYITAAKIKPPVGIFVLGMHRSGTSLVTSLLHEYGFGFDGPHLPPQPDNPLGFWEHQEIVEIHDDFLQRLGRTWGDPRPFHPDEFDGKAAYWARERLREVLDRDFLSRPLWVLKDPRTARLGPLWKPILDTEGLNPKFLIVVRSPIAVERSVARREDFSTHKTLLLWLRHYIEAEAWTRGAQRSWVLFEDIFRDLRGVIDGALRRLEFDDRQFSVKQAALDAILDPKLVHHNSEGDLKSELWSANPWVVSVWEALKMMTAGQEKDAVSQIDKVRNSIGVADDLMNSDPSVWDVDVLRHRLKAVISSRKKLVNSSESGIPTEECSRSR